jgi:hypothetical protein
MSNAVRELRFEQFLAVLATDVAIASNSQKGWIKRAPSLRKVFTALEMSQCQRNRIFRRQGLQSSAVTATETKTVQPRSKRFYGSEGRGRSADEVVATRAILTARFWL